MKADSRLVQKIRIGLAQSYREEHSRRIKQGIALAKLRRQQANKNKQESK